MLGKDGQETYLQVQLYIMYNIQTTYNIFTANRLNIVRNTYHPMLPEMSVLNGLGGVAQTYSSL